MCMAPFDNFYRFIVTSKATSDRMLISHPPPVCKNLSTQKLPICHYSCCVYAKVKLCPMEIDIIATKHACTHLVVQQ